MKYLIATIFGIGALSAAQSPQTFSGTIVDDICARDGHASMRMGPTDAECTKACVMAHDSDYVLEDGKNVYRLSDQKTPEQFAARKVKVVGALDAKRKTITVDSITAVR